ncbi:hypothetical protein AMECASPLE_037454 [Ameca splendens]|uniref:Uncharacterized protein n=1 Tax=Ameca splendens TaxID=208324 RepID=A0ABV1AG41_9TELE
MSPPCANLSECAQTRAAFCTRLCFRRAIKDPPPEPRGTSACPSLQTNKLSAETWIPATAPRLENVTVEVRAPAQAAPASPARKAAVPAAHLAAVNVPLVVCAKGRPVTRVAASEEPDPSTPSSCAEEPFFLFHVADLWEMCFCTWLTINLSNLEPAKVCH